MPRRLTVAAADDLARLDRWLARELGCSRHDAQRLIDDGMVRVSARRAIKGLRLTAGEHVDVERDPPRGDELRPLPEPEAPLQLIHVDEALVAMSSGRSSPSMSP